MINSAISPLAARAFERNRAKLLCQWFSRRGFFYPVRRVFQKLPDPGISSFGGFAIISRSTSWFDPQMLHENKRWGNFSKFIPEMHSRWEMLLGIFPRDMIPGLLIPETQSLGNNPLEYLAPHQENCPKIGILFPVGENSGKWSFETNLRKCLPVMPLRFFPPVSRRYKLAKIFNVETGPTSRQSAEG